MLYLVQLPLSTNSNGHEPRGTSSILQALFGGVWIYFDVYKLVRDIIHKKKKEHGIIV
jgi:hypothetical protein